MKLGEFLRWNVQKGSGNSETQEGSGPALMCHSHICSDFLHQYKLTLSCSISRIINVLEGELEFIKALGG
jgi:hypothetical protein